MYVCVYIYIYICVCVCIYIHTYIYTTESLFLKTSEYNKREADSQI